MDWEGFYGNYRNPDYIAGYQILNKLGSGVFGIVYKARKESIGKDYAIKFLKVDEESVKKAVLKELDSLRVFAQVDDPNLVSIEDKGEVDGIPYIVMGYAGEETLEKRLSRKKLSLEESLAIVRQVLSGVGALHRHSIVHFDLKPGNVFLKGDFVRVGDYGLSRLMSESRKSLSFSRGTPYYMAPELLRAKGDRRSDIYSLGVLLYECVVGEVPFQGDLDWEVLGKHENERVSFPTGLDPTICKLIEKMMEKKPEDRPGSVSEVIDEIDAVLSRIRRGSPEVRRVDSAPRGGEAKGSFLQAPSPRRRSGKVREKMGARVPDRGSEVQAGGGSLAGRAAAVQPVSKSVPVTVIAGFILSIFLPFLGVIFCWIGLPEAAPPSIRSWFGPRRPHHRDCLEQPVGPV